MLVAFADKLRITARVLGCTTQKELCAKFYDVNPHTQFSLQNSYKWIKGRTNPRAGEVFEDWAKVLDIGRPVAFLRECTVEDFVRAVGERHGMSVAELLGKPADQPSDWRQAVAGEFALYSVPWTNLAQEVCRGSMTLSPHGKDALKVTYHDKIPGGQLTYRGKFALVNESLHGALGKTPSRSMLFMSVHVPSVPVNAMAGIIAGSSFRDSVPYPAASRILCVRKRNEGLKLAESNGYLRPEASDLRRDIERLGYAPVDDPDIGQACVDFLFATKSTDRLEAPEAEREPLTAAFDRLVQAPAASVFPLRARGRAK